MSRYVVQGRDFDFAEMSRLAEQDQSPKHILNDVCAQVGADVVSPSSCPAPSAAWRVLFRLASVAYSNVGVWTIAHHVAQRVSDKDVVYVTGEDLGVTISVLTMLRRKRPALVVPVIWPERTRATRLLLAFKKRISSFVVVTEDKARQVRALGGDTCPPVVVLPSVVDLTFFSAASTTVTRPEPLVVSAGLVDRDYVTLAAAVNGLPIRVEVCAMSSMPSPDAGSAAPSVLPDNMAMGHHDLRQLRDLYRSASLVVVPLVGDNRGSGLTVVWEAMACGAPVLATRGAGDLAEYAERGLIVGLDPEDADGMRAAIVDALAHPGRMKAMAERARAFVEEHFNDERYVKILSQSLEDAEASHRGDRQSKAVKHALPIA